MLRRTFLVFIPLALFAGGCSDGDDTASDTTTTIAPTTTTIASTTTVEPVPPALDLEAAEAAMDDFLELTGSPGVMVGVQVGTEEPVLLARGVDNVESGSALQPDRLFRVGSVTKPIVASVLFEAAVAGRISLDDRLGDYVDDVTNPDATIAQILAHNAGLADWDGIEGGIGSLVGANLTRYWDPLDIVEEVKALPSVSEPGAGFSYSNPGYQMLGAIIERVNSEPIASSVARVLADGHSLNDIAFGPFDEEPANLVYGYRDLSGTLLESRAIPAVGLDSLFYTTGAAYSDLDDLLAFSRLFWGADQALSPDGIDVAEDQSGNYGFATQIIGDSFFGHTGSIIGSRTLAAHHRERDITIVLNANFDSFERQDTIVLAEALLAAIG